MSCNIENWKTKELKNLSIPLKAFFEHKRTDWHPEQPRVVNFETMEIEMDCCEGIVKGILKDGILHVTKLEMSGEGSGTFKSWILDEALKQSTGELEAVLVWEGGEVSRLKVKDGVIEEKDIEL
jgi:hypothetical protein